MSCQWQGGNAVHVSTPSKQILMVVISLTSHEMLVFDIYVELFSLSFSFHFLLHNLLLIQTTAPPNKPLHNFSNLSDEERSMFPIQALIGHCWNFQYKLIHRNMSQLMKHPPTIFSTVLGALLPIPFSLNILLRGLNLHCLLVAVLTWYQPTFYQ